jgi:hypothetical protein
MSPQKRGANLNKAPAPPLEVSIACALNDADKALAVLFTMLQKAAPQGASVADEIRGNVRHAQFCLKRLVKLRCATFVDNPDAPGTCVMCGDAPEAHEDRPIYTKAEAEALCAIAVAAVTQKMEPKLANARDFVLRNWHHYPDCPEVDSRPGAVDLAKCNCGLKIALMELCSDCPPPNWSTDKTRCAECPNRNT